ncbi:MarR family transcriptional regulator [Corynebacterium frankenforstense]|uniref:MarR family winged helix-turn-helix transcriptional regulator n=1 Tax=Corynebacterium frankenforstense TaxID=1230998 RepID=UPI00254BE595|nr:MarR family transcriptional regulator [Corynebacterium frankenforstense]MDK6259378.1 MarR family transcriptional regulator [Corynebacterium frankenforstense]
MRTHTQTRRPGPERFLGTELAHEIQFLLARTSARGSARANAMLKPLKLKVRQYSALSIAASGLRPTQREMAFFLQLDPSQVVPILDQLEDRGLINRETDPNDRRSRLIVATEAGMDLYRRAHETTLASEDITLDTLTPREREQLRTLLMKIVI